MAHESNVDSLALNTAPGALRSVRWLAEGCRLPPADIFPQLARDLLDERAKVAVAHCCWWARHPNLKGKFASLAREWSGMTDEELIAILRRKGYDGLLYFQHGKIIGHFFFQRHGAELHAFSGWVAEPYREQKLLATFAMDFLAYASQCAGVVRARVGTGEHPVTQRLLAPLRPHLPQLGWVVAADGWVDFRSHGSQD
jgi:hypothetical protein